MPQETCEVKVRRGENVDRALRRLKKALDKEGIIKGMRSKRYYEKPSEKRKRFANSRRTRR
jgi:small subunit ribosomal protein S21